MSRRPTAARGTPSDSARDNVTRGALLLAVAAVLGIFILSRTEEGVSTSRVRTSSPVTTARSGRSATSVPPTSRPARPPADVKVLPVNASGVSGLGAKTAERLKAKGYTNTLAPTNATTNVTATSVQFANDAEPEALAVAQALDLPASAVKAMGNPPVSDTRGADVVVLIGPDLNTAGAATTTTARSGGAGGTGGATSTTSAGGTTSGATTGGRGTTATTARRARSGA
ncbi:MAG TPA: LytR C-terminal domain-containing protein [Acidimicrobiales bacterium]|nr:LytR C-terminal domain-containing protein [Acidimicrobiales bacterium]